MSLDLVLGRTGRNWSRNSSPESLGSDPIVWTPSAVRAELERVRDFVDLVNQEMTWAVEDKKITGSEWGQWSRAYRTAHKFLTGASSFWGSNVAVARQHESVADRWRQLLRERGGRLAGPRHLSPTPTIGPLQAMLVPALAGSLATMGVVLYLTKKKI